MPPLPDARIPVLLNPHEAPADPAWLIEGDADAPGPGPIARFALPSAQPNHPAGCFCCAPRGPVAAALSRLFLARARGEIPFFRAVAALARTEAGRAAIASALTQDVILQARYRLES